MFINLGPLEDIRFFCENCPWLSIEGLNIPNKNYPENIKKLKRIQLMVKKRYNRRRFNIRIILKKIRLNDGKKIKYIPMELIDVILKKYL
jgi:hypothetical protein